MPCPNCLHEELIIDQLKINELKKKFSAFAKLGGYEEYAIVKCNCKEGYSWRPIEHPDAKKYGIEYCIA